MYEAFTCTRLNQRSTRMCSIACFSLYFVWRIHAYPIWLDGKKPLVQGEWGNTYFLVVTYPCMFLLLRIGNDHEANVSRVMHLNCKVAFASPHVSRTESVRTGVENHDGTCVILLVIPRRASWWKLNEDDGRLEYSCHFLSLSYRERRTHFDRLQVRTVPLNHHSFMHEDCILVNEKHVRPPVDEYKQSFRNSEDRS